MPASANTPMLLPERKTSAQVCKRGHTNGLQTTAVVHAQAYIDYKYRMVCGMFFFVLAGCPRKVFSLNKKTLVVLSPFENISLK